jgi:transcriptional regulator with XRE-family HTH domain
LKETLFASRLLSLRKQKGLSQYALAEKLEISRGQIAGYELGRREPNYNTLIKIANFFNVTLDYLLCNSNELRTVIEPAMFSDSFLQKLSSNIEMLQAGIDSINHLLGQTKATLETLKKTKIKGGD